MQVSLQMSRYPSGPAPSVAAMLNRLSDARERLLDAADLLVDFLTLGEYGLEPRRPQL